MSEMLLEGRLKIKLLHGWQQAENPAWPVTYFRSKSADPGALQFSRAQYRHGVLQTTTEESLMGVCDDMTSRVRGRRFIASQSGKCEFGFYGTVSVRGDEPAYFQAWVVSNGHQFILITHTCNSVPVTEEIAEANQIALMTTVG
jgi:hypothetical protein